ncbi:phosphotransferase family protein [Virgibacillus necropolis]|uniref:Phosphotransferase n=1 Tax=Virgibacillus necropolis TaxID=163877 RepID=A0A221MFN0_9BACI|nr:aminoglycoside phosphotransferase family protein [Virgibacillus necropolis]ASN06478.1 phosphotransferase [Virgibacillus necropolis]
MTTEIIFASNKLGVVTTAQLQLMLDRFDLGKLISFEKTAHGAMGQTMFISSTAGDFVLKGNPLFPGQFVEEKFFIENIQKRTKVTVSTPFMIDDAEDIFGWSYSVMPRLTGEHMNSPQMKASPSKAGKLKIAELIAETLTEFHSWKVQQFGEFETKSFTVRPFKGTYTTWLCNRIRFWLNDAKKYSVITSEDILWVETLLEGTKPYLDALSSPTFVMGDFKSGNFLLKRGTDGWKISGVFDFTNSYFGDPLSDLIKMLIIYLDNGEQEVAKHLLSVYLRGSEDKHAVRQRIRVHMLQQRILDWGCAKAIGMVTWDDNLSFSNWVESYTETAANLLD